MIDLPYITHPQDAKQDAKLWLHDYGEWKESPNSRTFLLMVYYFHRQSGFLVKHGGDMSDSRHENYEILNLIGYGLAKFDLDFARAFSFTTKTTFYKSLISKGIADSIGTIKNRQDLFDPFFSNERKGWWQKGNTYLHRKLSLTHYLQTTTPASLQAL